MRILSIIGARPQFIKAAAVSRKLREKHEEILLHTGQHYDANMSEIFFDELEIPYPDINLAVGSNSHAKQTADMLVGIEEVLMKMHVDCILVYGDTNSTLAGALAAAKLLVPVVHVEAGVRSFNMNMPEEQNRVLTDHISTLLLCPTRTAVENLCNEGVVKGVYQVGDVMCDAVYYYSKRIKERNYIPKITGLFKKERLPEHWYLSTIHRAENTDDCIKVRQILEALQELDAPAIFPVHPRTKKILKELMKEHAYHNIIFTEPVGYLDMLYLTEYSKKVVTDSGGVQKEAYLLNTPCITVRDQTEWVETLEGNFNVLAKPLRSDILNKVFETDISKLTKKNYFGDGDAVKKILDRLKELDRY